MNANEFSKAVEEAREISEISGVDEWIATEMLSKATSIANTEKNGVSFSSTYFYNKGWLCESVVANLIARGFKVQKHCDDFRGDVWYEISW